MNHKLVAKVAIAIVVVFLVTIVVYPLIFNPVEQPAEGQPVELELDR